jgi:uncharacterized protein (DUF1330 family)
MNTRRTVALSMLAGIAIGATAVEGIRAQDRIVPTYYIAEIEVTDFDGFTKDYLPRAEANIKAFGGRIAAATAKVATIEGEPPKPRVTLLVWDDVEKMQIWRNAPESRAIDAIGHKHATFRAFTVEGAPR